MSRFGLGHTVAKTVHKYPVTRFLRVHGVSKVRHRYPIGRYGSRNGYLDMYESVLATGDLLLDSVDFSVPAFTENVSAPFTVSLTITHDGAAGTNDIEFDPTHGADVTFTFEESGDVDVTSEYTIASDAGNVTQIAPGQTVVLVYDVTPDAAVTNDTIDATVVMTATDETTTDAATVTGAPTDAVIVHNTAAATLDSFDFALTPAEIIDSSTTQFTFDLDITNSGTPVASDLLVSSLLFLFEDTLAADVTSEYTIDSITPAFAGIAPGATETYTVTVTPGGALTVEGTPSTINITLVAPDDGTPANGSVFVDATSGVSTLSADFIDTPGASAAFATLNHAQVELDALTDDAAGNFTGSDTIVVHAVVDNTAVAPEEDLAVNLVGTADALFSFIDTGNANADVGASGSGEFTVAANVGMPALPATATAAADVDLVFDVSVAADVSGVTGPVEMRSLVAQLTLVGEVEATLTDAVVDNSGVQSWTKV